MTQQHASPSNKKSPRNIVNVSPDPASDWSMYAYEVSKFVYSESVMSCSVEKPDPSKFLSGNSVSICKLTVNDKFSYHAKLLRAPDAESVYLQTVRERYPAIVEDSSVLIPTVVDFIDSCGVLQNYLHLTRWVPHIGTLAEIVILLWSRQRHSELEKLLRDFGKFLKAFHTRYPRLHHNDMNPSNVLIIDLPANRVPPTFALVDCAGLDDEVGDDFASFLLSMDVLDEGGFGPEFKALASEAFTSGYS